MATLATEVTARFSTAYLKGLTNPQVSNASSINTTILGYACTDVQADFKIYVGADYVETNAAHISAAVECVILKLMMRTGQYNNSELEKRCQQRLKDLALIDGRNRVMPISSGEVADSSEEAGQPADFDRGRFPHYQPDSPGDSGSTLDPPRD